MRPGKLCILQLFHPVYAIDYIQMRAIIPGHQDAAGIINTNYCSEGADGRCLSIVHLNKFHPGSGRIAKA